MSVMSPSVRGTGPAPVAYGCAITIMSPFAVEVQESDEILLTLAETLPPT